MRHPLGQHRRRGALPIWFVSMPAWRRGSDGLPLDERTPVHGKQMGTNRTACGLYTDGWVSDFQLGFPTGTAHDCGDCLQRVEESWVKGRSATT